MSSFGDIFPFGFRSKFARTNLKVGSIIKLLVLDTIPPKTKYLIIVGLDKENISFATVFINSVVNINVLNTPEL